MLQTISLCLSIGTPTYYADGITSLFNGKNWEEAVICAEISLNGTRK